MSVDERAAEQRQIFESYGRLDASELADRLRGDLEADGYQVWRDVEEIHAGSVWFAEIEKAIASSDVMVALLSPHAVRSGNDPNSPGGIDSVCLDEISMARFGQPPRPIVPVMAISCQPPLPIFRLDYVDLTKWKDEESYQTGLARLKENIAEAIAHRALERPLVTELDPFDFGAFLNAKRRDFEGREWLFEEIETWRTTQDERALLITGDPGSGKSAFVAELVYRNPDGQVVAYHCCQSNVPDTCKPGKFVRSVAAMLSSQLPEYAAAIERGRPLEVLAQSDSDPESAFAHGIVTPLNNIDPPAGDPRYILIDALDDSITGAGAASGTTILDVLHDRIEQLPSWLRLVATTRHERAVLERFRGVRTNSVDAHDKRNLEDVEQYLRHRLTEPRLVALMESQHTDPDAVCSELCTLSDGSFLYAQQALESLLVEKLQFSELAAQPPGLGKLYDDYFERTFPDEASYSATKELLAVLLASRGGLTSDQLCRVLSTTAISLEQLLAPLSGYITIVEGRISLFHKSLADWLTDPQKARLRFVIDVTLGQTRLLDYCKRWTELDDDYPLREFPSHLAEAQDLDGMLEVLSDSSFIARRERAGVGGIGLDDYRRLATMLLETGRTKDVVILASTPNSRQRDGITVALREAPEHLDEAVRAVSERLARTEVRHKGGDGPTPTELNAVLVSMRTAAERGYRDQLVGLALDESPAVLAMLVPYLYRFWKMRREEGWKLLDELAPHFCKRLGAPREEMVTVIGGLGTAIVSEYFDDRDTMTRLGKYLAERVKQSLSSPVGRALGRSLLLKVGIAALTKLMKDQPEYQPVNLPELNHSIPASPEVKEKATAVLEVLERPERGVDAIADLLTGRPDPGYNLGIMMIAERALVVQGARDPASTMAALRRIFHDGYPWLQQSVLYAASKILETSDLESTDPAWVESYVDMTTEFVRTTRATLETKIGTYSVPTAIAGVEVVLERHSPAGTSRFIPECFALAMAEGDLALATRVIKATHLLSLLGHPLIALDALDGIVDATLEHQELTDLVVDVLANIRLYEDRSVYRFLSRKHRPELTTKVLATPPSLSANEFPTMIDFFANHQLVNSEDGRREICGMFRKQVNAKSGAEVLHDVVIWVIGLLTGETIGTRHN
ncbi:MAG TPA: toll/interleukin-1 receptor domain-containing protein [Acidimicrobiales bacterium]|nr:toll/interleukin-1 receptor domain-containing protein [Acidimicrobiales bacterium]